MDGMGKACWNRAIKMHGYTSENFFLNGKKRFLDLKQFEYTHGRDC